MSNRTHPELDTQNWDTLDLAQVSMSRNLIKMVLDHVVDLARNGNDFRKLNYPGQLGLKVSTPSFGPLHVFLQIATDGRPVEYVVTDPSILPIDCIPYGRMDLDGMLVSDIVSYRLASEARGLEPPKTRTALLGDVMVEVACAMNLFG